MIIRKAKASDVEQVVDIMFKTWRTTYTGIISDEFMSLRESKREERIIKRRDAICGKEVDGARTHNYVAEDNRKIVGFVVCGKCMEEEPYDLKNCGEIYALYILQEYQGQGIGKELVNRTVKDLIDDKFEKVVIWALKDNPCVEFYRKIGGDGRLTKDVQMGEQKLEETGFVFDDINKLFERTKPKKLEMQIEYEL